MTEHRLPALIAPLSPAEIAAKMATGHSVFGPSGAEMTMTCAESLVLNARAEDRQTYEAAEGTVAHSCLEEWFNTGIRPDKWIGMIEIVGGFEVEITDEMLTFVGDVYDWLMLETEGAEEWSAEQHVDISKLTPIPGQGGTADFVAFRWQHMTIGDLKYGKDPVFAENNKQLQVYALGIFYAWDWLYNFQTIKIMIGQPRVPGGMTEWTISRDELLSFADFARERWAAAWVPGADRTPSIKGCRWCAVRATCPALYLFAAEDLDVFEDHDALDAANAIIDVTPTSVTYERMAGVNEIILDEFEPSPFPALPSPPEMSTLAMSKLLRYRKLMETFFNAIAQELLTRAISHEEELIWWKIVESRSRRKWVEDEEWIVNRLTAMGLKRSDIFVTKMRSPAEMERVLHTKLKITLKEAKASIEDGMTVKPPGQKTLAQQSDTRKALPKDTDVFFNYDLEDDDI